MRYPPIIHRPDPSAPVPAVYNASVPSSSSHHSHPTRPIPHARSYSGDAPYTSGGVYGDAWDMRNLASQLGPPTGSSANGMAVRDPVGWDRDAEVPGTGVQYHSSRDVGNGGWRAEERDRGILIKRHHHHQHHSSGEGQRHQHGQSYGGGGGYASGGGGGYGDGRYAGHHSGEGKHVAYGDRSGQHPDFCYSRCTGRKKALCVRTCSLLSHSIPIFLIPELDGVCGVCSIKVAIADILSLWIAIGGFLVFVDRDQL